MNWLVFAQTDGARLNLVKLAQNARAFFPLSLEVLEERGFEPGQPLPERMITRLRVEWSARAESADFCIEARPTQEDDLERARLAETRCRGGGLAALAARCAFVWSLEPAAEGVSEPLQLAFAALLASVALGPILPPDAGALYGVRGARERVDQLIGPSLSR